MDDQASPQAFAARRRIARQNVDKLGIKYEELPQLPFWAPLFGGTYAAWKLEVADVVVNTSALLGRGLSPVERDVISHLAAKRAVTQSYEPPISVAAAIYLERRGRATSKFPFYTPKPTSFDPTIFPSKRWYTILQGVPAIMAWNATRFGCYAFVAHFVGGIFFQSYATSVQTASMLRDPRLADLRRGFADRRRGIKSPGGEGSQPWQVPEDPSMRDAETPYGDASYSEEASPATAAATTAGRTRDDVSARGSATTPSPRTGGTYPQSRQQPTPPQSTPSQDEFTESSFFDDDASPVAPAARTANAASNTGGSAWERLRRQSKTSPAGQGSDAATGAPRSRTWGQNAEQYTYSQEDSDRASAKDQAQREFDAMLEKERQGESDSRGRRW